MRVSDTIWKHEMRFCFCEFDLNKKTPRKNITIYTEIQDQKDKRRANTSMCSAKSSLFLMSNQAQNLLTMKPFHWNLFVCKTISLKTTAVSVNFNMPLINLCIEMSK